MSVAKNFRKARYRGQLLVSREAASIVLELIDASFAKMALLVQFLVVVAAFGPIRS